jgi:hypothetical protein
MVCFVHFYLHVSPSAIQRWAAENDYKIVNLKAAGLFEGWSFA